MLVALVVLCPNNAQLCSKLCSLLQYEEIHILIGCHVHFTHLTDRIISWYIQHNVISSLLTCMFYIKYYIHTNYFATQAWLTACMHLLLIFTKNWFKQLNGYICFPGSHNNIIWRQYYVDAWRIGVSDRLYIKLIRIYMTKTKNVRLRLPFLEKRPKMLVKVVRNIWILTKSFIQESLKKSVCYINKPTRDH
jgi:hypothetical protein